MLRGATAAQRAYCHFARTEGRTEQQIWRHRSVSKNEIITFISSVSLETKKARAVIHEPRGGAENPLKCLAGLVLGINIDAGMFFKYGSLQREHVAIGIVTSL